ncbi:hypothetical protein P4478_00200 [Bacillus subtilis]|nr:hypothetical protein [Bacillus subtilis]
MELKKTNHYYYCSDSNFYVGNANGENYGSAIHETWKDFKEKWFMSSGEIDHDYNHCFRYDIDHPLDENDNEIKDKYYMKLYMMHQRKGRFIPVLIRNITEDDMPEIEQFLKSCWDYLCHQWNEVR